MRNATSSLMSKKRRQLIASLATRHQASLVAAQLGGLTVSLGDLVMSAGVAFCVSSLLRKQPTHPQAERSHSLPSER